MLEGERDEAEEEDGREEEEALRGGSRRVTRRNDRFGRGEF